MPGIMVDKFKIAFSSMYAEVRSVCEKAVGGNRSELAPSYSDVRQPMTLPFSARSTITTRKMATIFYLAFSIMAAVNGKIILIIGAT